MLTVRLPKEMEQRLDILARETKRPKSYYVREALERCLEDLEDAYLAEARYEQFLTSGEPATPLDAVLKRYGLDG